MARQGINAEPFDVLVAKRFQWWTQRDRAVDSAPRTMYVQLHKRKRMPSMSRFYYHSFPRRGCGKEIERGLAILRSFFEIGYVLTPETLIWKVPTVDGNYREIRILQKRMCFTELAESELSRHATKFGSFALEFDVDRLKFLGALPVFYDPQDKELNEGMHALGSFLVMALRDSAYIIRKFDEVERTLHQLTALKGSGKPTPDVITLRNRKKDTIAASYDVKVEELQKLMQWIGFETAPFGLAWPALEAISHLFYPADDLERDDMLAYYRQREWRLIGNAAKHNQLITHAPQPDQAKGLLDIDADFFGKEIDVDGQKRRLVDESLVLPCLGDTSAIGFVRRIIVPEAALLEARRVLDSIGDSFPLEALESLPT